VGPSARDRPETENASSKTSAPASERREQRVRWFQADGRPGREVGDDAKFDVRRSSANAFEDTGRLWDALSFVLAD